MHGLEARHLGHCANDGVTGSLWLIHGKVDGLDGIDPELLHFKPCLSGYAALDGDVVTRREEQNDLEGGDFSCRETEPATTKKAPIIRLIKLRNVNGHVDDVYVKMLASLLYSRRTVDNMTAWLDRMRLDLGDYKKDELTVID